MTACRAVSHGSATIRYARLASIVGALAVAGPVAGAAADGLDPAMGQAVFERIWVPAPASTQSADGLGPLFNARSCVACHPRAGRGRPPEAGVPDDRGVGFVLRLADDPVYGRQIQTLAGGGPAPEGRVVLTWRDEKVAYADGGTAVLRRPVVSVADLAYGPLAVDAAQRSPRLAPSVRGLGLLERVPEAEILAAADPDDRDGDGIAGRPNRVTGRDGTPALGRFGWKAAHPTVDSQNAEAFHLDLGMSGAYHPEPWGDCTPAQTACREAPHGDSPQFEGLEIPSAVMAMLGTYVRGLPPAGGLEPPADAAGAELFAATGCAACHRPTLVTGDDPAAPRLSNRTLYAYTDLLLHDMGEDLADGVAAGEATGRDWRTAPLWGLRAAGAEGEMALLHDGRARGVAEAVLWHGGEAAAARQRFLEMPVADRQRLIRFVGSL
ncbi:di-heme oxidoredictase family protein [Azospirillum halopraeferens]|uniref:di-heme oxidoredictase family protein n=1 Tax=Azospirillum halopraeferens TaxID=34010 RepID=UPI0003FC7F42|nr:di-heme oxidoredictase family protein [Azospirillum halopraeferens]